MDKPKRIRYLMCLTELKREQKESLLLNLMMPKVRIYAD